MRFLKRLSFNPRIANDPTVYSDVTNSNVYISPYGQGTTTTGQGSVVIPNGTTLQRPSNPVTGMMRYNTDVGQVEMYQSGTWRYLRFKESTNITQQNLGAGDGTTVYFGPLNPAPPTTVQSGATWGGQNIIVVVENVMQLSGLNYTVVQNPTVGAETYTPTLSVAATVGSTTLYFNTSLNVTGASGTGSTATLTFATQTAVPFAVGASIIVTGITPLAYNGTFTVTASTTSSVSYASSANATYQNGGNIAAALAAYPAVNLIGAAVTGTNQGTSSTLSSVVISSTPGQFNCASTVLAVNQAVIISGTYGGGGSISGYSNPKTYYIIATNTTNTFTLSATPGGPAITTTSGTPTGLTFTLPNTVLSYTTDPTNDSLNSITVSKPTITSTIAVNTTVTITQPSIVGSGYYLQFTSPVPYGKVVIALIGFDT